MNLDQEIEEALLDTLLEMETPAEQQALLTLLSVGNSQQADRLRSMIDVREKARHFFREAEDIRTVIASEIGTDLIDQLDEQGPPDPHPAHIGPYRIHQRIGEGGCGVVYLAEQLQPVRRHVALKVIRLGMDTERVIALFELERQALAMMEHPNIAHVLDAGATQDGRPYFAMEWVRGQRITDFCDENKLNINERIQLFIEVCKGIQHAHQKGIIHRDIKPSNILITTENGKPAPKIIDFGIAKTLDQIPAQEDTHTQADPLIGTPAYMSPEQADARTHDIDTRSDVYSLGMLLYELLTGRTPFDSKALLASGITHMRRTLLEVEPPAPSKLLSDIPAEDMQKAAFARSTTPKQLLSALKGDLDSIILSSIEKDPLLRYPTANAFKLDLQRHANHQPILARPPGRAYLFGKFVRRNRIAVATTAAILLSLIAGLGTASSFYLREKHARQEQARLRQLAEAAHASEQQRLAEAREWEHFAKVSMLLSEGKTELADEQLRDTPIASIKFNPQMAEVVRSLGNWNALRGRWQQAADCFLILIDADEMDSSDSLTQSFDMAAVGPAIVESGNTADYTKFRKWALQHYRDTSSTVDAQRLLHTVLLTPADATFLRSLETAKSTLENADYNPEHYPLGRDRELAIWQAFGLALLEYRLGNHAQSIEWANRALAFEPRGDYINAALLPVRAMANFHLGHTQLATDDLLETQNLLEKAFTPELPAAYEPLGQYSGYWWDWIIARRLHVEAQAILASPTKKP